MSLWGGFIGRTSTPSLSRLSFSWSSPQDSSETNQAFKIFSRGTSTSVFKTPAHPRDNVQPSTSLPCPQQSSEAAVAASAGGLATSLSLEFQIWNKTNLKCSGSMEETAQSLPTLTPDFFVHVCVKKRANKIVFLVERIKKGIISSPHCLDALVMLWERLV